MIQIPSKQRQVYRTKRAFPSQLKSKRIISPYLSSHSIIDIIKNTWNDLKLQIESDNDYVFMNMFNYISQIHTMYINDENDRVFQEEVIRVFNTVDIEKEMKSLKSHPIHFGGFIGVETVLAHMIFELCLEVTSDVLSKKAESILHTSYSKSMKRVDVFIFNSLVKNIKEKYKDLIQEAIMNPSERAYQLRALLRTEYSNVQEYVNPLEVIYYKPRITNAPTRKSDGFIAYTIGDVVFDILVVAGIQEKTIHRIKPQGLIRKIRNKLKHIKNKIHEVQLKGKYEMKYDNDLYDQLEIQRALSNSSIGSSIIESLSEDYTTNV